MIFALLLLASAFVTAEPSPYKLATISKNPNFGLGRRQDAGYSPTQTDCGSGDTCATACGASYIQCASTDDSIHCYDPTIKESCCPDGSGNSCSEGYFCTSDTSGDTWRCPDGMDLVSCAAAYSLTDSLVSQVATAKPTTIPSSTSNFVSAVVTSSSVYSPSSISDKYSYTESSSYTTTATPVSNGTVSSTTTAAGVQFTGGAEHVVAGGMKALALAAGAFLVL
ncbi:hypothetical protein VTL71DRAFT_2516 [Oculimacula yallundae]|uniref:Uncharacterized protein n=1 Tax=Oculimacula yallundae TaxID=86028 RepID=A0ABR4C9K5_9HELO